MDCLATRVVRIKIDTRVLTTYITINLTILVKHSSTKHLRIIQHDTATQELLAGISLKLGTG